MKKEEAENGEWWKLLVKDMQKYEIESAEQLIELSDLKLLENRLDEEMRKQEENMRKKEEEEKTKRDALPDNQNGNVA